MSADITGGISIGANDTFSPSLVASFMDGALIENVTSDCLSSETNIEMIDTAAPSDTAGMIWFDTTNGILRRYNAAESVWAPFGHGLVMTNDTGDTIANGAIVVSQNSSRIAPCTTAGDITAIGVAVGTIADGAQGIVQTHGVASMLATGAITFAERLEPSEFTGEGHAVATKSIGVFAAIHRSALGGGLHSVYLVT